jgi:RNA polymerase sigma-70 factor (ECF subfamily)
MIMMGMDPKLRSAQELAQAPGVEMLPPLPPPPVRAEELEEYRPKIRSVVRRILNNPTDIEDVTQDVMVQALANLDRFRADAQLGTWLHRIATNAALYFRRQRASVAKHHETRVDDNESLFDPNANHAPVHGRTSPPDNEAEKHELRQLIQDGIAKLPEKYRQIYILADLQDESNETIAREMGMKLNAVKSRLHRARLLMRNHLAPHVLEQEPPLSA